MVHARKDYDRIQDPALSDPSLVGPGCTPIAEDEPVILFRAQDVNFIEVLQHYIATVCKNPNYDVDIAVSLGMHVQRAKKWQSTHAVKQPDMPPDSVRHG